LWLHSSWHVDAAVLASFHVSHSTPDNSKIGPEKHLWVDCSSWPPKKQHFWRSPCMVVKCVEILYSILLGQVLLSCLSWIWTVSINSRPNTRALVYLDIGSSLETKSPSFGQQHSWVSWFSSLPPNLKKSHDLIRDICFLCRWVDMGVWMVHHTTGPLQTIFYFISSCLSREITFQYYFF
jgi:hypothetical protein